MAAHPSIPRLPTTNTALLRSQPPAVPPHLQSTDTLQSLIDPITLAANSRKRRITNWGGTFTAVPSKVFQPSTVAECCAILELARRCHQKVRVVGKAHSPSDLMMSEDWCILIEGLSGILEIDSNEPCATFLSGTIVSDINEALAANSPPLALRSLGSISEQTIGGLISTATHGSGIDFPCVSAFVQELEIILPLPPQQGGTQIVKCSRTHRPDVFNASLCGLGATGLIVTVKIQLDPAFRLRHLVEEVDFDYLVGMKTSHPKALNGRISAAPSSLLEFSPSPEQAGPATLDTANGSESDSIGKLLAHGKPLPPPLPHYLPRIKQSSPADIWPSRATEDDRISRNTSTLAWSDPSDDDETRHAQQRLERIVRSAQHTRLWYFPHVNMATLSRANRTLDPPVAPTWGQRAYASVVGYHLTEFLLYISRYHHSLPSRIGRLIHYLTHPAFPQHLKGKTEDEMSTTTVSTPTTISSPHTPDTLSEAYTSFISDANTASRVLTPSSSPCTSFSSSSSLSPLSPGNPHSISTDHSWKVFNMDCLFPQYTTEWSIPFHHTASCLRALRDWLDEERRLQSSTSTQLHMPLEIRFTSADGIWLSHGYGRLNTYIGLIAYRPYNASPPYRRLFRKFESLMRYYAGRPHWAKEHTCGVEELRRLYPHWDDWKRVRDQVDPEQVMVNAYVARHVLGYVGEEYGSRVFKRRQTGRLAKL